MGLKKTHHLAYCLAYRSVFQCVHYLPAWVLLIGLGLSAPLPSVHLPHSSEHSGTRHSNYLRPILGDHVLFAAPPPPGAAPTQDPSTKPDSSATSVDFGGPGIFSRAFHGGLVVFSCLLILIWLSILSWAVAVAKFVYLGRLKGTSEAFIKSFWDSRSLNDLNGRLGDYPYSPPREVFRVGYGELVRGSQIRDQAQSTELAINAALENLGRSLQKAKIQERRKLERYLLLLSITASVSPFIGLFGTVWGIMGAFEGIAQSGSASLAAVAPGISEALIATAFGLAAAIPAVIGYNIFVGKIRGLMGQIDGFCADFLNIVQRYLVTDRPRNSTGPGSPTPGQTSL